MSFLSGILGMRDHVESGHEYDEQCKRWLADMDAVLHRFDLDLKTMKVPTLTDYAVWSPVINRLLDRIETLEAVNISKGMPHE